MLNTLTRLVLLTLLAGGLTACGEVNERARMQEELPSEDEQKIRAIHSAYVEGWLGNDEDAIMGLLAEDPMLQPNQMRPVKGRENIRAFWFPKDSSITTITTFDTEIIFLEIMDTLAVTTHRSLLVWTYEKDTLRFGREQRGINTTVYKRQPDSDWKIWSSMWTDIVSRKK